MSEDSVFLEPKNDEVVHVDLNLAQLPLLHIRGTKNGTWKCAIDGRVVEGTRRLTRRELAVYAEILSLFEQAGMPEDGSFFSSQNGLIRDLIKQGRGSTAAQRNALGFEKKRLKNHLSNIHKTILFFDGCFRANGVIKTDMTEPLPLLKRVTIYERERDEKFFLSRFRLDERIVANMRAGYFKPLRVAVISHFKSEKALALWLLLDRQLSFKSDFNKDLKELCDEIGISFERQRDYVPKMREICKLVQKVPITNGYKIKLCHIVESKTPSGYKLVAFRSGGPNRPKKRKLNGDTEEMLLIEWYQNLKENQRKQIDERVETISKEINGRWWNSSLSLESAKLESIRRAYHDAAVDHIVTGASRKLLTFKAPPPIFSYHSTAWAICASRLSATLVILSTVKERAEKT